MEGEKPKMEINGILIDIDYIISESRSVIRLTMKEGGKIYTVYDPDFCPYFYLVPHNESIGKEALMQACAGIGGSHGAHLVEKVRRKVKGIEKWVFRVETFNTKDVPVLSEALLEFGERYEYDILFWKRYLIDKGISPLYGARILYHEDEGRLIADEIKSAENAAQDITYLCFDIETYNPLGAPRLNVDPVIMISFYDGKRKGVITTKEINRNFVKKVRDEKELIEAFTGIIEEGDYDFIVGYNSSNFDIPYLIKRAEVTKADFRIGRYGEAKAEHHGLVGMVKIPGRANIDIYNVAKFISIVGASEKLIRANRLTLSEVYRAITGSEKLMVDRRNIWQLWDNGSEKDLEELADYSLGDVLSLNEVYRFFMPLEMEMARITSNTVGETCISTTGQLVEYFLMRYAHDGDELVPNKPSDKDISRRQANPIEGAYVKTPDAGIYKDIVVYDFRGLYPSIIIAYNIDPSTLCDDCTEYYESPTKAKFRKGKIGIIPKALKLLMKERSEIKKAFKKDPDNKSLMARSQALKILANSFYGYLGYARSRWYSRDCAESVTAFGRAYISMTMEEAEKLGFRVLYGDTDSIFLLKDNRPKEDALNFLNKINKALPESMELELEDFYVSGVFVGKRGGDTGAKKKYALLSESGRIKIRGFELVRRDWSNIARETQRRILESVLGKGGKEDAVRIIKETIKKLRDGDVDIKDLVIHTQLRKRIESYDAKSPELSAAKKAIEKGVRKRDELEGSTIDYVITKNGSSISEKAELEEIAKSYDADYYINNQVIPATLKILKELGINEEELRTGGSQKRL